MGVAAPVAQDNTSVGCVRMSSIQFFYDYQGVYLFLGLVFFMVSCVLVRACEKRMWAPSSIFFVAFLFHTYLDVWSRGSRGDVHLNLGVFDTLFQFNVISNVLLLAGYGVASAYFGQLAHERDSSIRIFTQKEFKLTAALIVMLGIASFFLLAEVGLLTEKRGEIQVSDASASVRYAQWTIYPLYSLVPAIFLYAFFQHGVGSKAKNTFYFVLLFSFAISFAQLGRQTAAFVLLVIASIYLGRTRSVPYRNIVLFTALVALITAVAVFRTAGVAAVVLVSDSSTLTEALAVIDFDKAFFQFLLEQIPGQSVFSNTVVLVESSGFFYGKTYLLSFLTSAIPFFSSLVEYKQPAYWYKSLYAPEISGHGFDFGLAAEAYMNFGLFGSVLYFPLGAAIAYFSTKISRSANPAAVIFCSLMIVNFIFCFRNDSVPLFTRAIYFILPYVAWRIALKFVRESASHSRSVTLIGKGA